jgi:hypothetical protein
MDPTSIANVDSRLNSIDSFFTRLKGWVKASGVSKQCTTYSLIVDDKSYIVNIELEQGETERKKSKDYLYKMLSQHWIREESLKDVWNIFY